MSARVVRFVPSIAIPAGIALAWFSSTVLASPLAPSPGRGSITVRAYGVFAPPGFSSDSHSGWSRGGGGALEWEVNHRLAFSIDAASIRIGIDGTSLQPVVLGFVFGPGRAAGLRPWIEGGAGYYGLLIRGNASATDGLSSSGNLRDSFQYAPRALPAYRQDGVGGYFGAGFDWMLSSHVGLGTGLRVHIWRSEGSTTDGLVAARSGLSYRF